MIVTLMGMQIKSDNKGCEALTYSFIYLLEKIAENNKIDIEYRAIVFSDNGNVVLPVSKHPISCISIDFKALSFYKTISKVFKESDLIFDFTGGDSFSDIYGKKRFYLLTMTKMLAIKSKSPFILGPQTYGPFYSKTVKWYASRAIKKSYCVFARDAISQNVAQELSGRSVELMTDVAFSLPYEKVNLASEDGVIKVGFNPSGLLWAGGYTETNQFGLTVDYQKYCKDLLEVLSKDERYRVYLIPHVSTKPGPGKESDYNVCQELKNSYQNCVLCEDIDTPIDAKNVIASMDVFIGARMHATIAAFSANVATIPFSYSRKFEGLYNSFDYDYMVHATKETTEEAVNKTLDYINDYQMLKERVNESSDKVKILTGALYDRLTQLVMENKRD